MMDYYWFLLTLGGLSTFRLSMLIAKERGPGNAARKIRAEVPRKSSMWDGIRCVHCCSLWVAAPIATLYAIQGLILWEDVLYWYLSIAAISSILHLTVAKDFNP